MKKLYLYTLIAISMNNVSAQGLVDLTDTQLAEETGQALFNLSYIAPTDSANLMNGKTIGGASVGKIGFYKLGMEAEIELNANIRKLQLGCGGRNGPENCDIEINNLALSGLPNGGTYNAAGAAQANGGYDDKGVPVYNSDGRAATSAKLVNPFMEFAIKNPDSASTREVLGFRASAEKIFGLLTAGIDNLNYASTTDGIQNLSGFMRIAATSGTVNTKEVLFGNRGDQQLGEYVTGVTGPAVPANNYNMNLDLSFLGTYKRIFTSQPGNADNHGITVPALYDVPFVIANEFQVNGNRQKGVAVKNIAVHIAEIPMGKVALLNPDGTAQRDGSGNQLFTASGAKNQLYVTFDPVLGIASKAKFQMADGSKVTDLNLDVTFQQALSMIHNIPLTGNGGYLSLQNQALLWPGAYTAQNAGVTELNNMTKSDVAQPGWWMSFADPVQLGKLKASESVDISDALPQVADLVSLGLQNDPVQIGTMEGLATLVSTPIVKQLVIPLMDATTQYPAQITLQNIKLQNQNVTSNCYGTLKFC